LTEPAETPFDDAFLASLPRLELAVQRLVARGGDAGRRSARRGGRVEFGGHRGYVPGDDLRHIDWSVFARSGHLFVKEFEHRDDFVLVVVVDDSASMPANGKLLAAQRLGYALAYFALAAGHRVRVHLASGGELRASSEIASRGRLADVAAFLSGARGRGGTRLTESLRRLGTDARGGRLVVLLSDLLAEDDARGELAARVQRRDDVAVFHLVAAADFTLPAEFVIAVDAETGERRALGPGAAASARVAAAQREGDWRAFAARHGIAYVPLDAALPVEELLRHTLRDAGVLR
jgi:uncharacterized protein (DUF58 family)